MKPLPPAKHEYHACVIGLCILVNGFDFDLVFGTWIITKNNYVMNFIYKDIILSLIFVIFYISMFNP